MSVLCLFISNEITYKFKTLVNNLFGENEAALLSICMISASSEGCYLLIEIQVVVWKEFNILSQKFSPHCGNFFSQVLEILEYDIKGSRQRERRGFGKVSNIRNMSRTAAIDVLFSFNFTVVFDFMYFRFRPSKAK
jgi:hypothetical protein